ncbi:hypothetical protein CEUSTIGMA_g451.t1 [Chlamydomonas eustigma]|uniref:Protein kinase domain-containing protein n=1 Tax=Chlamydomonas eustigma TaxID=1157962 RepID=A0A250WQN2_9CHLO|nr:hypothetical protein CEUSTIGMA_g451.t1 [Chlamydomonas eustigma]|eukprot:GAX72999.1 hypothetical protein CEUSTIGMA_g451.t1 [Chlamydomonas eustigma]
MTAQMKGVRSQMEEDDRLKALMDGLRGANMNESDFASSNVRMKLVEIQKGDGDDEQLPLTYDPEAIAAYWDRRPVSIVTRILQLLGIGGGFISRLIWDAAQGRLSETEVARAIDLREIMTSLGPAYIKLGQALSIRPDILSPAAMNELQKLCDKVPSFENEVAMKVIQDELGKPWQEVYAELTPEPIAAASLGQVYKGRLKTGEQVAVKVQRPYVLETVTVDLYIIRSLGVLMRQFLPDVTKRADIVALLDEWATRFFEELDYVKEGQNATRFAEMMKVDLPQVVVPVTYSGYTSRRVLTTGWLDGEKLSQSNATDVGTLVNVGVICFLKQLLEHGFFHSDPHPGNLIRTPDGRLAILDFGLMSEVSDDIKFGMIEAISHLIHRDYEAIVKDFVTLEFIPEGTDLRPILPVLAKVFDQALEGGGAKNINFQELAADLAQITFDYPFRIPPYFALIIRAISVLEGIALVGNPEFALVDEAYPYISKRLLTDDSPRLRAALKYMVYGRSGVFDADRLIDLLGALEDYSVASTSARGEMDLEPLTASSSPGSQVGRNGGFTSTMPGQELPSSSGRLVWPLPGFGLPFPGPFLPGGGGGALVPASAFFGQLAQLSPFVQAFGFTDALPAETNPGLANSTSSQSSPVSMSGSNSNTREALRFILSKDGVWFREFVMDEMVKSIDAMSREQLHLLVQQMGLQAVTLPVLLPGAKRSRVPIVPEMTDEDRQVVQNVTKIVNFLTRGQSLSSMLQPGFLSPSQIAQRRAFVRELMPVLPTVATEVLPGLVERLVNRVAARVVKELYL